MKILFIILAIIYTLSPLDIIPDFPIWGWLDDLAIWGILLRYLYIQKKKAAGYYQYYRQSQEGSQRSYRQGEGAKDTGGEQNRAREATDARDPYTVLGVDRNASPEDIKKAYRQLVNKYHPDKVAHLGNEFQKLADKRFKEIQEAYPIQA